MKHKRKKKIEMNLKITYSLMKSVSIDIHLMSTHLVQLYFLCYAAILQVLGAAWYLLSIERYTRCLKSGCRNETDPPKCMLHFLDCICSTISSMWLGLTQLVYSATDAKQSKFPYGIFEDAVKKNVVSSSFIRKYLYCLWWGLQQLSSYGQNLNTSLLIFNLSL